MPLGWKHVDQFLVSRLQVAQQCSPSLMLTTMDSCYKLQFSSYLQVVYDVSVSKAGYILNIFNIVSCAWGVPVGLYVVTPLITFHVLHDLDTDLSPPV